MKKMRKTKVITVVALTVVMLAAMTGLAAAAESLKVLDPATDAEVSDIELAPSSSVTYDLKVGPFLNNAPVTHLVGNQIFVNSAPIGQESDITVEYQEQSPIMGPWDTGTITTGPYIWTQETARGTYETLKIKITLASTAPIDADYTVAVMDVGRKGDEELDIGRIDIRVASVGIHSIPEFATIAIPVAAILGLVLFFNHRKRKKE